MRKAAPILAFAAAMLAAATAAATPSAIPASAEGPRTLTDVRCIIVAGSLAQSDDPDLQKVGQASLIYFWGRLEGRDATADIASRVAEEAAGMTPEAIKQQAGVCGALVTAAGQSLQDLGEAVKQKLGTGTPAK